MRSKIARVRARFCWYQSTTDGRSMARLRIPSVYRLKVGSGSYAAWVRFRALVPFPFPFATPSIWLRSK